MGANSNRSQCCLRLRQPVNPSGMGVNSNGWCTRIFEYRKGELVSRLERGVLYSDQVKETIVFFDIESLNDCFDKMSAEYLVGYELFHIGARVVEFRPACGLEG